MQRVKRKQRKSQKKIETYEAKKFKLPFWLIVGIALGGFFALSNLFSSDTNDQDYMDLTVENPPDRPDYFAPEPSDGGGGGVPENLTQYNTLLEYFTGEFSTTFILMTGLILAVPFVLAMSRSFRRW